MDFKKYISFLLAIFLLVSNTGFALDVHYCGGKVAAVNLSFLISPDGLDQQEKGCCTVKVSTKTNKKERCCKNKVVHIQKKSGKVTLNLITFQADFVFLANQWSPIAVAEFTQFIDNPKASYFCDANAPPLFKLYHQYIFYA